MERRRRCEWLNVEPGEPQIVWARKRVSVTSCPTSYISSESLALLEEFHAWKLFGAADVYRLPARTVEAIFVLENELRMERNDGQN